MKIRTAVADYQKMFPEEYKDLLKVIKAQKENLKEDMAEVEGHHIKRALFTVSEKLSVMIGKKLDTQEMEFFKSTEGARWFAKEFSQFRISKHV
jgi:hypothetical protein